MGSIAARTRRVASRCSLPGQPLTSRLPLHGKTVLHFSRKVFGGMQRSVNEGRGRGPARPVPYRESMLSMSHRKPARGSHSHFRVRSQNSHRDSVTDHFWATSLRDVWTMDWGGCGGGCRKPIQLLGSPANCLGNCADCTRKPSAAVAIGTRQASARRVPNKFRRPRPQRSGVALSAAVVSCA